MIDHVGVFFKVGFMRFKVLSLLVLLFCLELPTYAVEESGWEKVTETKDIKIFSKIVPGSPVVMLKGVGIIYAPIDKIAEVLLDIPGTLEWVENLKEAKILKSFSEDRFITYAHFSSGVPFVQDRDFVNLNTVVRSPDSKKVFMKTVSIDDSTIKNPNFVRGHVDLGTIELSFLDKNKTEFTSILHTDPKGSVPKWIVNWLMKKIPLNSFESLKKRLAKKGYLSPEKG